VTRRLALPFSFLLAVGCFTDSPVAETTEGTAATTAGTAATGTDGEASEITGADAADTTGGGGGPVEVCGGCQSTQCTAYADACAADPGCVECLSAPYSLTCLADTTFHALANCSCEECAGECAHLCPGGQGACNSCGIDRCSATGNDCLGDPACAPCLDDAYADGCAENATWMAAQACACTECGQECIWQCPAAGNTCATCISGGCSTAFTACIEDAGCADCFEAPYAEGCADNELYSAVNTCTCDACMPECGVLFNCEP
jgi:hypothetical protein